jgi:hypothetical protein
VSKGLGRVGLAIDATFAADPDNAFSTDELCARIYVEDFDLIDIEKKHRVAVLRAAKRRPNTDSMVSEHQGGMRVFYTPDNVMSYAMARLKSDFLHYWNRKSDADLKAKLRDGGDHHHLIIEGGAWWRHVEMHKAERDGDTERLALLKAEHERAVAAVMRAFGRR